MSPNIQFGATAYFSTKDTGSRLNKQLVDQVALMVRDELGSNTAMVQGLPVSHHNINDQYSLTTKAIDEYTSVVVTDKGDYTLMKAIDTARQKCEGQALDTQCKKILNDGLDRFVRAQAQLSPAPTNVSNYIRLEEKGN